MFLTTDTIGFYGDLWSGNIFLTINLIAFYFIILSDLNSSPNNLVKVLFIRAFLVDWLMCLSISLVVLKPSKTFLPGSILINL